MAAADAILLFETVLLVAIGVVWGIHLWGSKSLKKWLSDLRHRYIDEHLRHY
jgi:hypothetical protein